MIKHQNIIWDWNGTLFNDAELCMDIMNVLLRAYGRTEISFERYRSIFTFPLIHYYKAAGHDISNGNFEKVGAEFIDHYEKRKYEAELHHGVKEILELFQSKGKKQYMLSAYTHEHLEKLLEHYGIADYFENIQGNDNIYADGKMNLAKQMIEKIGDRNSIIMIGDTLHDYEIAEEFGVRCCISTSGHQSEERFVNTSAELVPSISSLIVEEDN